MAAARKQLVRHVPAAADTHATEERCFLRDLCRDVTSKGQSYLTVGEGKLLLEQEFPVGREPSFREHLSKEGQK
jgi:hypothetical protein